MVATLIEIASNNNSDSLRSGELAVTEFEAPQLAKPQKINAVVAAARTSPLTTAHSKGNKIVNAKSGRCGRTVLKAPIGTAVKAIAPIATAAIIIAVVFSRSHLTRGVVAQTTITGANTTDPTASASHQANAVANKVESLRPPASSLSIIAPNVLIKAVGMKATANLAIPRGLEKVLFPSDQ